MNRTTRFVLSVFTLAALVMPSGGPSLASVFLQEDISSLRKTSKAVVHARVADIHSYWNAARSMIFTDVTLEVKARLHGSEDDTVTVRVPGGTVDDFTIDMEGAPLFILDEEIVVFLGRWHDGVPMVAGYFQGLSRVTYDKIGNPILQGGVADGRPLSDLARQLRQAAR